MTRCGAHEARLPVVYGGGSMTAIAAFPGPAFAQGGHTSCKVFGQNIARLATSLGKAFGQTAAAGAPLNDTVDAEQAAYKKK